MLLRFSISFLSIPDPNFTSTSHEYLLSAMVTVAPCCISCDAATAASAKEATACVASDACVVWMVISPPCSVAQFCSTLETKLK